MKQYDAIVIGAGIGGLASALLLAESGKKVALFEKTARTGGRLGSSARDGFTVDYGVHLISRGPKGPLIQLLERCGIEPGIEFTKAVSYTHLDVYKRQPIIRGMEAGRRDERRPPKPRPRQDRGRHHVRGYLMGSEEESRTPVAKRSTCLLYTSRCV